MVKTFFFFWSSLKFPSVFASNLTRDIVEFKPVLIANCAVRSNSLWPVHQKVWARLIYPQVVFKFHLSTFSFFQVINELTSRMLRIAK